jgi:hypothetical protein
MHGCFFLRAGVLAGFLKALDYQFLHLFQLLETAYMEKGVASISAGKRDAMGADACHQQQGDGK